MPSDNTSPCLDGRQPINYNFNHLQHSMVRLKNGGDFNDMNISSNGEKCLEDGEGNHECQDLHQKSVDCNNEQEQGSIPAVSHLPATPTLGRINHFAALGASIYPDDWPMNRALWMSGPSSIGEMESLSGLIADDAESIMSFSSSTALASGRHLHPHQLGAKVEMVYSLLSMLGSSNREDMSQTLLEMSSNRESCIAMRQSGCLPLLVQLLHDTDQEYLLSDQDPKTLHWAFREARRRAGQALHNIVYAHPDDKRGRREARVLRLLEQIRDYSDYLKNVGTGAVDLTKNENLDLHPGPAIAALMKLSFDEEHRHAMCLLGGLQAIAELIQVDHDVHENTNDQFCITVRRYAGMALTNLTFGDGTNKALLCSMKPFMQALVAQLRSPNEDLRQVIASVLRNLSWRADAASKQILREVDAVVTLMKTAMQTNKESTLKSILSALWNLSAHCSVNKADICAVEGALDFLVSTLTYKSASKTLAIVENGGGILRNVSSHIAVKEEYRTVLRKHNCLQTLLHHLKSPSLTIVSNACGTLWNLSARCQQDQQTLWDMGAVGMLRNLIHSKHKMISMGSAAALKNLLAARPLGMSLSGYTENGHYRNGRSRNNSPSLLVRKQRALEADLDESLSETCDNIDSPKTSPSPLLSKKFTFDNNGLNKPQYLSYLPGRMYHSINGHVTSPLYVPRSESRDSLGSTRSEPPHYKAQRERFRIFVNTNRHLALDTRTVQEKPAEWKEKINLEHDDNTNIVMQLFKSLHSNFQSNSTDSILPRSNNVAPVKQGVWEVSIREASKIENRNIPLQNSLYEAENSNRTEQCFSQRHSIVSQLSDTEPFKPSNLCLAEQLLCDFPDNKRPIIKESVMNNISHHAEPCNNVPNSHITELDYIHRNVLQNDSDSIMVTENCRASKFLMDTIPENVVLRKKTKGDISHWSSTSTLKEADSENTSLDHTPIAVSRCSSLSSLASHMQQSARSSWISDVSSRRTSGVISPGDIQSSSPDVKLHMSQFTDKAPDAESLGIPRPRPAWPSSMSSPVTTECISNNQQSFCFDTTEPCSLQQIVKEDNIRKPAEENVAHHINFSSIAPKCPNFSVCTSSGQNGESQTLNKRIKNVSTNHAIPNNTSFSVQHNNNNKLHSRVNNLSSSFSYTKSSIPIKANNVRLTQSVPNVSRPSTFVSCAMGSDLMQSCESTKTVQKPRTVTQQSDLDPVCDDNDNLLFEDIEQSHTHSNKPFQNASDVVHQAEHTFKNNEQRLSADSNIITKDDSETRMLTFISSESGMDTASKLHGKMFRKPKTSIPQMIRPWHATLDSDVHPKQLQVMSQNLPVYKGVSINRQTQEEIKELTEKSMFEIKSSNELSLQSDPSSISADSEVSSAEFHHESNSANKPPRTKAKKNKLFRRSAEISTPNHSSDEDNREPYENLIILDRFPSLHYSEEEEKGKEDERKREKIKELLTMGSNIPDLLEGATLHGDITMKKMIDGRPFVSVSVNGSSKIMTDSMELKKSAFMIAAELEELADDQTHSSASCFSDLDNIKPPSIMGEMSLTSSGLSDLLSNGNGNGNGKCYINGKAAVDHRRSLKRIKNKGNSGHRFVFKSVLQSRDVLRSEQNDKPISTGGSIENLSMRSSGTSELLDNINPPSVMEDISMTNSCTSLNSINSDILESRSQSLADQRSDSEMFQRLNAAAAMVQVYSRELSNIMTGSMKSSCNSDNLDQVKPPSVFQDIAEVTVEDGTEVNSDAMISDSELEEELPHDDDVSIPSMDTVHSPIHLLTRREHLDESSENLNSSIDGDSICTTERTHQSVKHISGLALTSHNANLINMTSNTVQHVRHGTLGGISKYGNICENPPITITNVSNIAAKSRSTSPTPIHRGPRIVKPINRETIRQMQEKKASEKPTHSIRGRGIISKSLVSKNNSQQPSSIKANGAKKGFVSAVRPTRTSALRASQSQKQADFKSNTGRVSPRAFLSKPLASRAVLKTVYSGSHTVSYVSKVVNDATSNKSQTPFPLVKQGTFTKDEPLFNAPTVSPQSPQSSKGLSDNLSQSQQTSSTSPESTDIPDLQTTDSVTPAASNNCVNKVPNKKPPGGLIVKKNSSNYMLRRNVSLPLQKRENCRTSLKTSPSNYSFGDEHEIDKMSGSSSSKSATFSRNSLPSTSSSKLTLKRANSQKEVTSKISLIWKKNQGSSTSNSSITENSITERTISTGCRTRIFSAKPQYIRPSNVPPTSIQNSSIKNSVSDKDERLKTRVGPIAGKSLETSKTFSSASNIINATSKHTSIISNTRQKSVSLLKSQPGYQARTAYRTGSLSFNSTYLKDSIDASTKESIPQDSSLSPSVNCDRLFLTGLQANQKIDRKLSPDAPPFEFTSVSSKEEQRKKQAHMMPNEDTINKSDEDSENSEAPAIC